MSEIFKKLPCAIVFVSLVVSAYAQDATDVFLTWTKDKATSIGAAMRRTDSVGNRMSFRGLKTDRAISYKMRATWLTPEVIRATARLAQLTERLSPERARALVAEAEAVGDTAFLIELDPNEGSGVIPLDWRAFLQPKGLVAGQSGAVKGTISAKLREVPALAGVFKRDYSYEMFWAVFPLKTETGSPLFGGGDGEAELIVNIQGQEGTASWPIPDSIRKRVPAPK